MALSGLDPTFNMSNRLKRKLDDLGVNISSSKVNESFCLIGTPLPPLEKSKDTGEFVPLWKQDVRDEKGRRRLHGAFTGGFSAGYFNTVGSKEGWAPSTFVSSRSDRTKQKAARPEDFMDEEDLQEIRDSKDLVDKADEMEYGEAMPPPSAPDPEQDSLVRALESAMLPTPTDSTGARILKKMGWKAGQGIGPRVTYKQRRLQDLLATGKHATLDDITIAPEELEASKHLYAPRDIVVLQVNRRDTSHGLGYTAGLGLNASVGLGAKNSGPNISHGFGLGALNDADEDDLDIYDSKDVGRRRTAWDHSQDDGASAPKPKKGAEPRPISGKTTFSDGAPVLAGFLPSNKPVAEDKWFPLPDIPEDWKPDPRAVWQKDAPPEETQKEKENIPTLGKDQRKPTKTANERGDLLGETPLPSAPRSVFEFMSQKDRERLKRIATEGPFSSSAGAGAPPPQNITIPRIEPHVAQAALQGYQPFSTMAAKHARYTSYLHSQVDPSAATQLAPLPGQKVEEFNKELNEFAKSAMIFKPMSGAMAGRFTTAAIVEHGPQMAEGLHTPVVQAEEPKKTKEEEEEERKKREEDEERSNPKVYAARMGMYGHLTRDVTPWQPARLLCKRFGIKDPEMKADGDPTDTLVSKKTTFEAETDAMTGKNNVAAAAAASSAGGASDSGAPSSGAAASFKGRRDINNIGLGEDETQGRDTLTYQKPGMDIFKAIFASDDEDSDDDDDDDEKGKEEEKEEEGKNEATAAAIDLPMISTATPGEEKKEKEKEEKEGVPPLPSLLPFSNTRQSNDVAIDLSTFKPTFVPRDHRKKSKEESAEGDNKISSGGKKSKEDKDKDQDKDKNKDRDREKSKSKVKGKNKKKALVSFAMDEDGMDGDGGGGVRAKQDEREKEREKERASKKRKREKEKEKEKDRDRDGDGDKNPSEKDKPEKSKGRERGDNLRDSHRDKGKGKDKGRSRRKPSPSNGHQPMDDDDDDDQWVEKPAPDIIKSLARKPATDTPMDVDQLPPPPAAAATVAGDSHNRGRKRAIDFLE